LWVFVGSRVQPGTKSESKEKTISDILKVVKFIHKFLNDEGWAIKNIKKIQVGKIDTVRNSAQLKVYFLDTEDQNFSPETLV